MSKKLLVAGVIMTLVAAVFVGVGATTASAQSMSLCQTVDALVVAGVIAPDKVATAKAAAGCGATVAAGSFTRDLTVGSTGADVTALQTMLGVSPATGYFGAITKAAVVAYQTSKGLPATGFVGPLTRAALNYVAPVVAPVTPATPAASSALEGTDGTISAISQLSQYSAEEVGAGQENVKVLGMEVTASKDGDIQLKSVKLTFDATGNDAGDSDRLTDYVDSVSIMAGSEVVATADSGDFTKDSTGIYSKTLTLDNVVLKADAKLKMYVAVDAVSNLDSGDINSDSWTVGVANIRFVDGGGVTTTDADTAPAAIEYNTAGDGVAIAFVSFSSAADTELKVTVDSASPDADIVMVDDTDTTDGVVLLKGKIQVKGTSDVWLDELPITLTAGNATDIDNITTNLTLTIDGEDYSESVSTATETSATVTFNDLDLTLTAGKTYAFTVSADILELDGVVFDEGDTLLASLTTTNRGNIVAENEEGDSLSTELSGSATGEAQEFRTQGISVTLVSDSESPKGVKSAVDTDNGDSATFTITFKVTAVGEDAYLATVAATGVTYVVDYSGTATTTDVSAVLVNETDTSVTTAGAWLIEADTSETITLTVQRNPSATDGLYRLSLSGVKWDSSDTITPANTYSSNLDSFVTNYVSLD